LGGVLPLVIVGAATFGASAPAAVAAPRALASACTYGPCGVVISVTVTYNANGTITITISGSGFNPHEQVQISITAPARSGGEFPATSAGTFSGSVQLPAGYTRGNHVITAFGLSSGKSASRTFTLTQASGTVHPCTASASNVQGSGVVLAAAYLSATCISSQAPGSAGAPPSGSPPSASGPGASQLPFTGFNAATAAAGGAILVAAGGGLVLASRRRKRAAWR
jgi:hypothetical protein